MKTNRVIRMRLGPVFQNKKVRIPKGAKVTRVGDSDIYYATQWDGMSEVERDYAKSPGFMLSRFEVDHS